MSEWRDFKIELPFGASGEIDTTCPECSGRRKKSTAKCLSVNVDKGVWLCAHCGWSGGLGTGAKAGEPLEYGAPLGPKTYQAPRPIPAVVTPSLWQKMAAWFADERGIPESVLLRHHITVVTQWCKVCEEQTSHVLFPYFRDGEHVNTKHRCVRKHFRMEPGAERILYGLPDVVGADTVVIVEGEIDKLSCEVAGFPNTVSVPDGAPSPEAKNYHSKFSFLESAQVVFETAKRVVIAVDADGPGQTLQDELARRIGKEKCRLVVWPVGIKDANECLMQIGAAELRRLIEAAEPVRIDGIWTVDDLTAELDDLYEHGFDRGVTTGWHGFDKLYRPRLGLVTMVTGIPSHGKSAFLDAMLVNLAVRHGWPIAICSPENQPIVRHLAGIMARYMDKPFHDGATIRMTPDERRQAQEWAGQYFAFVLPEAPTVDAILERVKAVVYRMGAKGVVLDPWNEIEHSRPQWQNETEYVSQCLSKLRRFARMHDVHLWIVAHPTKMLKNQDGTEPVPSLWDISGSANFRNKADYGLSVWRNIQEDGAPVQIHVTKVRFAETGELGRADFWFDRVTGRYREAT